ncbi:MAG: Rho termination factor N-terminal domain-containing protein, partial [Chloroflexota bacterium]
MNIMELETKTVKELRELAKEGGLSDYSTLKKSDLVLFLLQAQATQQGLGFSTGILEIMEDGFGFLRQNGLIPKNTDIYTSPSQIRRLGLRSGDTVSGQVRPPRNGERYASLLRVDAVNGLDPEQARRRPHFGALTPIFPNKIINLETAGHPNLSTRLMNLIAPVGRGQRGLIVSPPKAGKTMLLKNIAHGITANYEDIHLMVLLIG